MRDVKECYEVMEQSAWELDRYTLAKLVIGSRSWASNYVLTGWYVLTQGRVDCSKADLAKAETLCESEEDLAYVLHIESIAFLRMGDARMALEKEDACLALCRKTKNRHLAAKVLVHLGPYRTHSARMASIEEGWKAAGTGPRGRRGNCPGNGDGLTQ